MSLQRNKDYPPTIWLDRDSYEDEGQTGSLFDVTYGTMRERILLQRLIVIAQLPQDLTDRMELGAHYEKLNFQLSKKYLWDNMTGLLLIYPTCLLHVVESSRDVLISVLKDLHDMQQRSHSSLVEASKIIFMAHNPSSRLFPQWGYKVLNEVQDDDKSKPRRPEEEEEPTESLVCTVLSSLEKLSKQLEISKKGLHGSVLHDNPELIVSQEVLVQLLSRGDLLTPQQYLKSYNSPLHISMDFGQMKRSSCLTTI